MNILGISAYYHDSAAALVADGRIVAAAQEERFTRVKHDYRFPTHAIAYCLREAGITPAQLDYVGFYDKPLVKFERLLETYLAYAPAGFRSFREAMPLWLKKKLHLPREIRRELRNEYKKAIVFTDHHESHAASAFYPSPFEEAAILTLDGVGEWTTASFGVGRGRTIQLTHEMRFPHSLGLLYSAFTYYTGFKVNSGEYKLMGLAPYGRPIYKDLILKNLVDLKEDGSFWMDMRYFNYCQGLTMTSQRFHDLFGAPPRSPESPVTEHTMDVAASIQAVTDEIMVRAARHVARTTGMKNLCMAGGVALNCVGNGVILRDGCFENIWIQPAAGDAGGALGTALFIWHQLLGRERAPARVDSQQGSLLGPRYGRDEIRRFLEGIKAPYQECRDESELVERVARLIAEGNVIGFFHDRMEFGPRALGARSILGDARSPKMQSEMNLKIKFRESFRPFAPSVLRENVHEWFSTRPEEDSPYMLLVAPVKEEHRIRLDGEARNLTGIELLKLQRSSIPAITHVDYSARLQTVDPGRNGRYYQLIKRFGELTGVPVIINTSFNVRGEPIVCSPSDAYNCFVNTNIDVLVLEDFVLLKSQQPARDPEEVKRYLAAFQLD